MSIASAIADINSQLPQGTRLVAVSKYHPVEALTQAYDAGQRIFGESHAQELELKAKALPSDVEWHFIGHLQTNKVRQVLPFLSLLHSVDSRHLLAEVQKQAERLGRSAAVLLEVKVASEDTKYGFSPDELRSLAGEDLGSLFPNVAFLGLMAMATNTSDEEEIRREFHAVRSLFDELRASVPSFSQLSMGMSGDYLIAVQEGSTLVRVGTKIFGPRNYPLNQ